MLLLVLAIATSCATGSQPANTSLPNCAQILLIGVRGSGESATDDHALGTTLTDLYHRITSGHQTPTTAVYGLPYAARSTSADTVTEASARLATIVRQRHQQCPHEQVILAGFSLGAEILGDALQRSELATTPPPFTAATILADPRFNPTDRPTAIGTINQHYLGDRPRMPYPTQLADRTRSYCRSRDPICQHGDPTADKTEHGRYSPDQTCQAFAFIEQQLGMNHIHPEACDLAGSTNQRTHANKQLFLTRKGLSEDLALSTAGSCLELRLRLADVIGYTVSPALTRFS